MNNLFDAANDCIRITDPAEKVRLTQITAQTWQEGQLDLKTTKSATLILTPGLPPSLKLVSPRALPQRQLSSPEGQIALLHALAHIEFNAINLAWDAVYRFRDLPTAFYDDWVKIAYEEAQHFEQLQTQLQKLNNTHYGDLPAHNGLWEMAVKTAADVLERMALVPRVLEARGLDATPPIIAKVQAQGLNELVEILRIILRDEIGHVAAGSRWFFHCCHQRNLNPEITFQNLIKQHFQGHLKTPFNMEARLQAGFNQEELRQLERLALESKSFK